MAGDLVRFEPATPARRSYDEIQRMAEAIAKSRLFGVQSVDQVIALMLMAEAEGRHVASAMQDYSVIQGRPSLKAEAMLARFQQAGGKVQWTCLQDDRVAAVFSHPACAPVEIDWDMARAKQAGLGGKDMWKKFPRQMLRARVISEGVRTAFPGALGGMYAPEEVMDFTPSAAPAVAVEPEPDTEESVFATDMQIAIVREAMERTGTDETKFLAYLQEPSLETLTVAKYEQALAALTAKAKRMERSA